MDKHRRRDQSKGFLTRLGRVVQLVVEEFVEIVVDTIVAVVVAGIEQIVVVDGVVVLVQIVAEVGL